MATKLKEMQDILVQNYMARVNTFMRGKPAIGKTMTINGFVEKMRKTIPDFTASTFYAPCMSPMDIQSAAPSQETKKLEFYCNAALPNAYTDPDMQGIIFLGELPNTDPETTKLLQKYINGEDMSGTLRKPDGVVVIADGNRIEDKSGVQQQGRAFMSRFEQIEVYTDADDNVQYASKHAWHPLVQTFFKDHPALIDNYDDVFQTKDSARADKENANVRAMQSEEGKLGIWANMRSWERISRKEYAVDELNANGGRHKVSLASAAGNVGQAVAAQYQAHKDIVSNLVSYEVIMADPARAPIPDRMDKMYMLAMLVALRAKEEDFPKVRTFAERMPLEMQAVVLRNMANRKGFNLVSIPDYVKWLTNPELTALLTGK